MRIRIWNAYASNNSGSYSILGWFPTAKIADQVAGEILPVIHAHSAWMIGNSPNESGVLSPLASWATDNELHRAGDDRDAWPWDSGDNTPSVLAAGNQVLVHEHYTVTMPAAFGEFFYRRGGRVQVELDHTHHPLIATLGFGVPWSTPDRHELEYEVLALRESLDSDAPPFRSLLAKDTELLIREADRGEYWFEVAAVFDDLVAGVAAAGDLARSKGIWLSVSLSEALSSKGDPLEHLRSAWSTDPPF